MSHEYRPWPIGQLSLLPIDPMDWLPKDHLAPALLDVVVHLDLSAFDDRGYETRGAAGFDPAFMVSLVLYCLLRGQQSARSMARYACDDIGARFLAGASSAPGWRCIASFRQRYRKQLGSLFAQSVTCCMAAKIVDLSTLFADGSKFGAYANKNQSIHYSQIEPMQRRLQKAFDEALAEADRLDADESDAESKTQRERAQVIQDRMQRLAAIREHLEQTAAEKKKEWDATESKHRPHHKTPSGHPKPTDRCNMVDSDSRLMQQADGGWGQSYNVQLATEGASQVIVGMSISGHCADAQELLPTLAHAQQTMGVSPSSVVADGGYLSASNIDALESIGIDAVISPGRGDGDEHDDDGGSAPKSTGRTSGYKRGSALSAAQTKMLAKFSMDAYRQLYRRRKQVVEAVFGQIKGCPGRPGMRGFTVRGLDACRQTMLLVCAVHNFGKYLRHKFDLMHQGSKIQVVTNKVRCNDVAICPA